MRRLTFTKRRSLPVVYAAGLLLATLLLGACTETTRATAAGSAPGIAMIPAALVGTWLELSVDKTANDSKAAGFLAIGNTNVVVNLAGQDRVVGKPLEIALESGVGAGRMTLDNGLRLYLVSGRAAVPGAPTGMLALAACIDVELFRLDGGNERSLGRTRVWAQEAVQTQQAMRALLPTTTVVPTSTAKPSTTAAASTSTWPRTAPDRAFYATAAGTLAPRAERLIRLAERGANADALRAAWSSEADAVRRAQLAELDALAQAEPGQTRRHLNELATRQKQWLAFVDAFTRWAQASRS